MGRVRFRAKALKCLSVAGTGLLLAACVPDRTSDTKPSHEEEAIAQTSAALNATPQIGNFAIYAERSVSFSTGDIVAGGDVGVRSAAAPSFGPQLTVGSGSFIPGNLLSPSISLAAGAVVGDVETSTLKNNGGVPGNLYAFPASAMPLLPLAPLPAATGTNVIVPRAKTVTLGPGSYGALEVSGILRLDAGTYSFSSVNVADGAAILSASGAASLQIAGALATGQGSLLQGLSAKLLTIEVSGSDNASAGQSAVTIGSGSAVTAVMIAPHGTIELGTGVQAVGALAGFDVKVGTGCGIVLQSSLPAPSAASTGQQPIGSYTPPAPGTPLFGVVPSDTVIALAVGLPLRNLAALQGVVAQASDPTSPSYRHYVDSGTFLSTYAPLASDYQSLVTWAQSTNLKVVTYPNNLTVDLVGSAAQIEQAFYVNLVYGLRPSGTPFYEPDRTPSLNLSVQVLGVSGLDDYVLPTPAGGTAPAPLGGDYDSNDLRTAYLGSGSACSSLNGTGQSVGLFEFDGFTPADITSFESNTSLSGVPAVQVLTANNPNGLAPNVAPPLNPSGQLGTVECTGDIELAIAMAPKAQIVVFEGTNTDSILQLIANNPGVSAVSSSWNAGVTALSQTLLTVLAAQGQSFFEASGDFSAYQPPTSTCPPADLAQFDAGTATPPIGPPNDLRSLQYATLVGGTVLTTSSSQTYVSETTWPSGAGGILPEAGIPPYQVNVNPGNTQVSTTNRNIPDVSMVAQGLYTVVSDCNNGVLGWVGQTGPDGGPIQPCPAAQITPNQPWSFNGTSAGGPIWAAFTALANQQGQAQGLGPLGFANPALYHYASALTDIKDNSQNTNTCGFGYTAQTGYDLATGLGTPNCGLISTLDVRPIVNVGVSDTGGGGPIVCIDGQGFSPGGTVTIQYAGEPEFPSSLNVITSSESLGVGGSFLLTDNEITSVGNAVLTGVSGCTAAEIATGVVSVNVVDNTTGISATATIPASYFCQLGLPDYGSGCSTAPSVQIQYHQVGACDGYGNPGSGDAFSAGPFAAYAVFGIESIDNPGFTTFNFDPTKVYVQQAATTSPTPVPAGFQDFFDPLSMYYADFLGPFAAVATPFAPGQSENFSVSAYGATIVYTSVSDGSVEANQTSYTLAYAQKSTDPPVVLNKSNASQTSFPNTEDCSTLSLH